MAKEKDPIDQEAEILFKEQEKIQDNLPFERIDLSVTKKLLDLYIKRGWITPDIKVSELQEKIGERLEEINSLLES